ncbi:GNAT family N-acetyltransferase [Deinococcus aerophilus]|uniref:N-acetyltransferase domain-containing protein n=1 Tax=Deinococcus aerophilus TaxID=522488 RepID=A0ABQ2GSK7_9DEIO|nr:GNAT family N-acetyltransferase [Deinococcus aerophilus]GGM09785.1 hypothetical protein GCM10010841_17770 [Deinococcus aerophilus]
MELRPLTPGEVPAAAQTFVATFNAAPWQEAWTLDTAGACLSDLLALPRASAVGAWEDGQCLGAVLGHDSVKDHGLTHEIRELFVHPQVQGRGVGRTLLTRHMAQAQERGVNSLYLLTARDSPAEGFYVASGFRQARRQTVLVRP